MCECGSPVIMRVPIPAHLSHTGKARWAEKGVDACIARIVKALNDAGIKTASSCCGHEKGDGSIMLWDGRELIIRPAVVVDRELAVDPSWSTPDRSGT